MNTLLITHMYPISDSDKVNTLVIHDLVSSLGERVKIQVIAVKRDYNPKNFLKEGTSYSFILDNRIINVIQLFKLPRTPYMKKSKQIFCDFTDQFIKNNKFFPDIIWCESMFESELGIEIAKTFKAKLVIGFHNTDVHRLENFFYQGLFKSIFANSDGIIFRQTRCRDYKKVAVFKELKFNRSRPKDLTM